VRSKMGRWTGIYWLNPMANVIATMQRAIYKTPYAIVDGKPQLILASPGYVWYLEHLCITLAMGLVLVVWGRRVFAKRSADFAEEL
jgi:ABC-2 type transport system permease protein